VGGFIVLSDGRALALNNFATDRIILALAAELPACAFRDWLLAQQSLFVGPGMTSVDVRELTPENARALLGAIRRVAADPARADADITLLADMAAAAERGEPPMDLNPHMRNPLPPTGGRSGPGWVQ
jgi:hypothetical protein